MNDRIEWLRRLGHDGYSVDGLVPVQGYRPHGRPPDEVAVMEKAEAYEAHSVFFQAEAGGRGPVAQAFIYISEGHEDDSEFAKLHRRLWSWGGVPLLYRKTRGLVQLFRCAHDTDFIEQGKFVCHPANILRLGAEISAKISAEPWWDATRLRNGTLWDDPTSCDHLLSADSAHRRLVNAIRSLNDDLQKEGILPKHLRRKLLILSLLIAYLEDRSVLEASFFEQFRPGAQRFFQVLGDGGALVALLSKLEERFNGNVFVLDPADRDRLRNSNQLERFSELIEGRTDDKGQLTLWKLYSFRDLPVELISNIYQIFVKEPKARTPKSENPKSAKKPVTASSVYTPPFLVRLMLEESLDWNRLDRMEAKKEAVLDPSCGSGVFLVEAYKRLILHWRSRNQWRDPPLNVLRALLLRVHGVDTGKGVELAAFSLYLALCDALDVETIRATRKLFPPLAGKTLHETCFFAAKDAGAIGAPVGAIIGNPPFDSRLTSKGAETSYDRYQGAHGSLPDKQLAYLFLHESTELLQPGGVLCMLQPSSFLYNKKSLCFRQTYLSRWDVREILDFVSVRGLFQGGEADTKVVVVVAEAQDPAPKRQILHATFRRTGRIDANQSFDIDYYDLHWVPREAAIKNDGIWRSDLLGGGRVLGLADRLKSFRTLKAYADLQGWEFGEGFTPGKPDDPDADLTHIIGQPLLPSEALSTEGVNRSKIAPATDRPIHRAKTSAQFTPPMLLIREQMDLPNILWTEGYLTYGDQIVGLCAEKKERKKLEEVGNWLAHNIDPIRAYVAATSHRLFGRKATAISADDIYSIPFPHDGNLDISENEQLLIGDIVDYYRDLIRLGEGSDAMKLSALPTLPRFVEVFVRQINGVYKNLRPLAPQTWPGVICQPFVFGDGEVDWTGSDGVQEKLHSLLNEKLGTSLAVTRIARIYDASFVFLLKPDRLRFWLPSVALRDADETLADLRNEGL